MPIKNKQFHLRSLYTRSNKIHLLLDTHALNIRQIYAKNKRNIIYIGRNIHVIYAKNKRIIRGARAQRVAGRVGEEVLRAKYTPIIHEK